MLELEHEPLLVNSIESILRIIWNGKKAMASGGFSVSRVMELPPTGVGEAETKEHKSTIVALASEPAIALRSGAIDDMGKES